MVCLLVTGLGDLVQTGPGLRPVGGVRFGLGLQDSSSRHRRIGHCCCCCWCEGKKTGWPMTNTLNIELMRRAGVCCGGREAPQGPRDHGRPLPGPRQVGLLLCLCHSSAGAAAVLVLQQRGRMGSAALWLLCFAQLHWPAATWRALLVLTAPPACPPSSPQGV